MAKKKNKKRHLPKQSAVKPTTRSTVAASTASTATVETPVTDSKLSPGQPKSASPAVVLNRTDYARADVRRIGILAGACLLALAIAWYVFNHTGVGPSVYSLIKT